MITNVPLKTSDFDYTLPVELIAQQPLLQRDHARLLYLPRIFGTIEHCTFSDVSRYLRAGDRLVFNDTKVFPARLYCVKKDTGTPIELLFTLKITDQRWHALAKPAKRLKIGTHICCKEDPSVMLRLDEILDDGVRVFSLIGGRFQSIEMLLEHYGEMPLPPYIKRHATDHDRHMYQTIYAKQTGAVAAPTAGLHFTKSLLEKLKSNGIDISYVTLHVGIGTFRPVSEENPLQHPMHFESFSLNNTSAQEINMTKQSGGRIIAVGTTVVRVLEHCIAASNILSQSNGSTNMMILPGYEFRCIDGLITNFHLPRSTLLMLVSAFATRKRLMDAYLEAVENKYRFFSYGDAMIII